MIIVNATALDSGGALEILNQFIDNIPDKYNWLIFVSDKINIQSKKNVQIEPIANVKSLIRRVIWDNFGLNRWLKQHNINPQATISLQNTGFRISKRNVPQFIYYHQSIPFYKYDWNPFVRLQRTMWFYRYVYPIFVKLSLRKDTEIFVQLNYIKQGFCNRFNHDVNKIHVVSPALKQLNNGQIAFITQSADKVLFYPATGHFYKNHKVLFEALKIVPDTKLHITVEYLNNDSLPTSVINHGYIDFGNVLKLYQSSDALVFPSFIETFGLPLIEAALMGMPIIAADLPYAREVLAGYEGVEFVPYNNPNAWADAIKKIEKGKRFPPIDISSRPGWKELFESILSSIK